MDMENNTKQVSDPDASDKKLITGIVNGILDKEKLFQTAYFYGDEDKISQIFSKIVIGTRKRNPDSRIIRVNAVDFANDLIAAIIEDYCKEYLKQYRSCDVLLMDHFDRIGNFTSTMEEFYELFDYRFIRGNQIVIAGSMSPRMIDGLPDRVRTQLEGGILFHVE